MSAALLRAARAVANVFSDAEIAHETGPTLTCGEADVLARLMVAAGETTAATDWIVGHATGHDGCNDEADPHHAIFLAYDEADDYSAGLEAALSLTRDYVNGNLT